MSAKKTEEEKRETQRLKQQRHRERLKAAKIAAGVYRPRGANGGRGLTKAEEERLLSFLGGVTRLLDKGYTTEEVFGGIADYYGKQDTE